ncbi:tubby-like F-box protein 3 [Senna tora]|uniref:Tubby-like F-box protein 3 n=1 Tax=Senna tora TaxID=362788 RepID=A0A834X3V6_9FABA|nr:tubby-like F-box protein 3 [Senna tora]
MRSRSLRVVRDGSPEVVVIADGLKQSCWANMPQELLREVLARIEASESSWPHRKTVVACAGVCRSWRQITKEIVNAPGVSAMITFPISVKQCGPRENILQCFIKRHRSTQTYYLFLSLTNALDDDGKFLLAARKYRHPTYTDYVISLDADDISKGSKNYVGKLRSNFLGTKFTIYDGQPPHEGVKITRSCSTRLGNLKQVFPRVPTGNYPVAHISYELNVLGSRQCHTYPGYVTSRGPRRMNCVMDAIPTSAIKPGGIASLQTQFSLSNAEKLSAFPFFRSKSHRVENSISGPLADDGVLVLKNKAPRWHEQLQCWCLNFHGRVTVASVKNFQLVASPENGPAGPEHERVILQFGKVGKDLFTMDYQYPISAFQAFAICLSSFDTKIAYQIAISKSPLLLAFLGQHGLKLTRWELGSDLIEVFEMLNSEITHLDKDQDISFSNRGRCLLPVEADHTMFVVAEARRYQINTFTSNYA